MMADAQLLELCMASNTRESVKRSSLIVTRRALRKVFKTTAIAVDAMNSIRLFSTAKGLLGYRITVFLGVVAGVCARLPAARSLLVESKADFYSLWVREVIGSKTVVPDHISSAFHDFFSSFTTLDDLQAEIVPALEKALLRAPEVVLNDLITPMLISLPSEIDLSEILALRILRPLLANVKSSNSDIRTRAVSSFAAFICHCHDTNHIESIVNQILTPLSSSKIGSPEQRVLHANMLSLLPFHSSYSKLICDGLSSVASKESNEAAAGAEATALIKHLESVTLDNSFKIESSTDALVKGLSDKRPSFQKAWALRVGTLLWNLRLSTSRTHAITPLVESVLPKLLDLHREVAINPLPSAQTGLVVAGYIVISLMQFLEESVQDPKLRAVLDKARNQVSVLGSQPSFLMNQKVYTKLSSSEDYRWLIRALKACCQKTCLDDSSAAAQNSWTQSLLYTIASSTAPRVVQQEATDSLAELYKENPRRIGNIVIEGLWTWYRHVSLVIKESTALAAQTGMARLYLAVRSISPPIQQSNTRKAVVGQDILQAQLINMLVLCRPEILPRTNWIETCLRVGQDPGQLVSTHTEQCISRVNNLLGNPIMPGIEMAAYATYAELAFVAPAMITPPLVKQITEDLSVEEFRKFTPTDFVIARTPEGTAFIDVLSTKSHQPGLDKNAKEYDTLKWEEEVRSQIAQKKGQQKKVSVEEQAKVNSQLAKEARIREQVLRLEMRLRRGIGTIQGLARGPPSPADVWMGPSLRALLDLIEAGVGLILGDAADLVYLACADLVSLRLGSLRQFIGVATLRAIHSSHLADELKQEPLGSKLDRPLRGAVLIQIQTW